MAVPNLAPNYLGQVKGIRAQRQENEKQRAFESDQASKNFLRRLGGDVLGTALGIGADLAGTAFRDSLTKNERAAAAGTFYPDDDAMGESGAAIRQIAESRAATELRPQASFGEAAETGFGRRGIETAAPSLGGVKAQVLKPPAVTPAVTPLVQQARASEPVQRLEYATAFEPPGMARRGMEAEAPRRPMAAPPSPMAQRPAPMPPRETREAPGGYQPPRMMPSTTAAIARESGYREAIPSLPTDVRGLAQQAQDVRDKRALDLELLRKQLLWDEEQAKANVASLQARGASATAIAQAKQQEAIAKQNAQAALEAKYYAEAAAAGRPVVGRGGRVIWQPGQVATPRGSTEQGFGADFGPPTLRAQAGAVGGRGGAGGAARGGEEPTGDVLTIVRQNRNKKGEPVGPSQPQVYQEAPPFWRSVAVNPTDYGMNNQEAGAFKEAFRSYNAALPAARKGDPVEYVKMAKAQADMRAALLAGQARYKPEIATVRQEVGTSPINVLRSAQAEDDRVAGQLRAAASAAGQENRERFGAVGKAIPAIADAEVDNAEVQRAVLADPMLEPGIGIVDYSVGDGGLTKEQVAAAIRGANPPDDLEAPDRAAYNAVRAKAAEVRSKLEGERRAKTKAVVGTAAASAGMTPEQLAADLEAQGLPVPEYIRGTGPAPVRPPATPAPVAPRAAIPTINASTAEELGRKIEAMRLTPQEKLDLYNREAAIRGWE